MDVIRRVCLSEITELITKGTTPTTIGYEFQESGVNFLKIECFDVDGTFIESKVAHISEECNKQLRRSQLQAGDILFSIAGAIGRVAIVTDRMLPANTNQALAIIRIKRNDVYLPYIKLILTSPLIKAQFERKKQGVAQLNISLKDINDLVIPLPEIKQQIALSELFDRVTGIINARNNQLAKLDVLIKARFVEMFREYQDTVQLSDVAEVTGGLTKNGNRDRLPFKMPYLRVANVSFASIDTTEMFSIGLTEEERLKTTLQYGDLLFVEGNGSPDQIGRVAIWRDEVVPCVHQNHIIKARLNESKMLPAFAMHYFMSQKGRDQIKKKAVSTSGLYTLSVSKISGFVMPCPPISKQSEFAVLVGQVDKSKLSIQASLDQLETLKQSLMQEYFG